MNATLPDTDSPSRARILAGARREFADRGFEGARLSDIAGQAGLSHPTLLYHFTSKAELYGAVIASAVVDWTRETEAAVSGALHGFDQVASIIDAGFAFFASHPDFARILRREALDGGHRLDDAIAGALRPFLERAVAFLEREMEAGRLRRHDPLELMAICYGAVFTYFSDAGFRARLLGEDPLSEVALSRHRHALTELLGAALRPA
ncbi:MAG: TetR/AcrR family transcriptional regulator [Solirubrobacteraceae bacterium]|nr:TetR/AcrR family transcriptional regulator [Solirubrobacteraceae bacterium]